MLDPKVEIVNTDAARFIDDNADLYGVIIIDLPDPDTIDLMHVYSVNFYRSLHKHLIRGGLFVAQATSPYFSKQAFQCILRTIRAAGFSALPYHNHIPTMGEWGWVIGVKAEDIGEKALKARIATETFAGIPTRYVNNDAILSMIHFGKGILDEDIMEKVKINTELNPVLHQYYRAGSWGMY